MATQHNPACNCKGGFIKAHLNGQDRILICPDCNAKN